MPIFSLRITILSCCVGWFVRTHLGKNVRRFQKDVWGAKSQIGICASRTFSVAKHAGDVSFRRKVELKLCPRKTKSVIVRHARFQGPLTLATFALLEKVLVQIGVGISIQTLDGHTLASGAARLRRQLLVHNFMSEVASGKQIRICARTTYPVHRRACDVNFWFTS
jgi:hypothetical protein